MDSRVVRVLATLAAGIGLVPAAYAQVRLLGKPGSFPTIQAAIDSAADGDVVTIEDGAQLAGFTVGDMTLTILARNPDSVAVLGPCRIEGLSAERTVALVDLHLRGASGPALLVDGCAGQILLQRCTLIGGKSSAAHPGLDVVESQRVLLQLTSLRGANAGEAPGQMPQPGGEGLRSLDSLVIAYFSKLHGGDGSSATFPSGGAGGAGALVTGWGFFAGGSLAQGGQGGDGDVLGCTTSGDGGAGIALEQAQAWVLDDVQFHGGEPGGYFTCSTGAAGPPLSLPPDSLIHRPPAVTRKVAGPSWTFESTSNTYKILGKPGEAVWLLRSPAGTWQYLPAVFGWSACERPWQVPILAAGVIGADGSLLIPMQFPDLSGSMVNGVWSMQALCVDALGNTSLSAPHHIVVVNS